MGNPVATGTDFTRAWLIPWMSKALTWKPALDENLPSLHAEAVEIAAELKT